ncbi:MAG: RHS repeat-associated core domain-containing protein, partial [Thermoanaerobaculia bacterium]|nr:RHS repeat-associated core domain-containing protein [Thermoanaerobaculia bacterium]
GDGKQWEVTLRSAMGRERRYAVEKTVDGGVHRSNLGTDGLVTESIAQTDGRRSTTLPDGTTIETMLGPDPRFGMAAPITKSIKLRTPSGLERTETFERAVTLENPDDPLSLTRQEDRWTVAGKTTTQVYDAATRRLTTTSPEGRRWEVELDEEGRVVSGRMGNLESLRLGYDAEGRVVALRQGAGAEERVFEIGFNTLGQVVTFSDPLMNTVSLEQDAADRVLRQLLPSGREISSSYDASSNLTSVTPPSQATHNFGYTSADLLASYTPPVEAATGPIIFAHNLDHQLAQVDRTDGRAMQIVFNAAGQIETVTHSEGILNLSYDPASGQPSILTVPGSILSFTYDGQVVTETTWSGDVSGSVGWSYDTELRVTSEQVNGSQSVAWQYDRDNLPIHVGDLVITRDAATGFITEATVGSVATRRSHNAFGELVSIESSIAQTLIYRQDLERDKTGRIVAKTETVGTETHRFEFFHDIDGQLVRVERNGLPWAEYGYDANGNRLTYRGVLGDADGLFDAQDRLLEYGDKSYAYTASGELETITQYDQITQSSYDVFGSLTRVSLADGSEVDYLVDALGRRIGKKINGVLVQGLLYTNELKPIAELDGAGSIVSRFVYGTNSLVPDYLIKDGLTYRIVADYLGSPRLVINIATGEAVQRLDYDEFGRVLLDTNPGFQPFGFAGGLYDHRTKLLRFGSRDYAPEIGRWTAKEPLGFAGTLNFYAYAWNDPINVFDPDGNLAWVLAGGVIGAAINIGLATVANGGDISGDQLLAAAASGFVAGAVGAVAGPLGGTFAKALGRASSGLLASLFAGVGSAAGGVLGQAAANLIDPCHQGSLLKAGLWAGIGGGMGKLFFKTKNLNTIAQATNFAPRTIGGLFRTQNAWWNLTSQGASAGIGGAANF